jgi:hypothetical protein
MFNAARAAVAVTVIALVSGLAYVAVPTVERIVTPASPATIDPTDFAGFSGKARVTSTAIGTEAIRHEWGNDVRGAYFPSLILEVDDPRLSGTSRSVHNGVRFTGGPTYGVRTITTEFTNDGGSWEGTGVAYQDPNEGIMRYEFLLAGHGDYEGLSAILSLTSDSNLLDHQAMGVIFPGELPPYPVLEDVEIPAAWTGGIDPADYAGVSGTMKVVPGETGEGTYLEWGQQVRGNHYRDITMEVDDPRLSGTLESLINFDHFLGGPQWGVRTTAGQIVNDDGTWVTTLSFGYQNPATTGMHYVTVYRGTGDYEGLSALTIASEDSFGLWFDIDGVIFPGELPPYPELPPAE